MTYINDEKESCITQSSFFHRILINQYDLFVVNLLAYLLQISYIRKSIFKFVLKLFRLVFLRVVCSLYLRYLVGVQQ